jgi:hypothetical protein
VRHGPIQVAACQHNKRPRHAAGATFNRSVIVYGLCYCDWRCMSSTHMLCSMLLKHQRCQQEILSLPSSDLLHETHPPAPACTTECANLLSFASLIAAAVVMNALFAASSTCLPLRSLSAFAWRHSASAPVAYGVAWHRRHRTADAKATFNASASNGMQQPGSIRPLNHPGSCKSASSAVLSVHRIHNM